MTCQLPYDCLNDILEYLNDDNIKILYILFYFYDKSRNISTSIITTLIGCLPKESKKLLIKDGVNITIMVRKPPLFNYASFCKSISICKINKMIQYLLENQQSTVLEILSQEILKMFMNQISSLKVLDFKHSNSGDIKFIYLPEAKIHLENLTELKCAMFKNLQELHIDLYFDYSGFGQLHVCKFLEINGKNLTELCILNMYYYSLLMNLTLAKLCPNLRILYSNIREKKSLKLTLNNCQYLEIIELCYKDWQSGKTLFKILANYSQKYFHTLILDCYFRMQINYLLQDLEEFSKNWQNHNVSYRSFSLIIFASNHWHY
ncbi:hypothetical protein RhiirC2_792015 [Rhizophagus irregularis]|uniref:F-box domain-containing protein n=1 Tax=Rhizophagus irregularis TaxID=588596 RepID=A0A2N1MI26_9GLOM|nr:hypothetical protein RhiirC2_792015 [Rhizophagus irregularis]